MRSELASISSRDTTPMSMQRDMQFNRRRFLTTSLAGSALLLQSCTRLRVSQPNQPNPLASFDREVEAFMKARKVPGGALAVVKDRRLVYTKGYGWADRK